jgi:hypothetical protein
VRPEGWACPGAVALLTLAAAATAQQGHPHTHGRDPGVPPVADAAAELFLDAARHGTERFHDHRRAVAAGYRLLGPDFPGMGEHWLHPGLTIAGGLDPARPQVLTYAPMDGHRRLIGVAWAVPLRDGEPPPATPFGAHWHDHTGTIDGEAVLLSHALSGQSPAGSRIAMLHGWIWLENPAGVFADNNWSLPFARLGLVPSHGPVPDAAGKALSLVTGGGEYFTRLFRSIGDPDPTDAAAIAALLDAYAVLATELVRASAGSVRPEVVIELEELWHGLGAAILDAVSPATATRLDAVWPGNDPPPVSPTGSDADPIPGRERGLR